MRTILLLIAITLAVGVYGQTDSTYTQRYLERSTRFAWLTYGGDLNYLTGGQTERLFNGSRRELDFGGSLVPRLTVGGIHFWGHADFYVSFPLSFLTLQSVPDGLRELTLLQGVETGARVYPFKLQPRRISPFAGISFRRIRYAQEAEGSEFENGTPSFGRFIQPIQFGLTYTSDKWHISASGYYNYQNNFDYYLSPTATGAVKLTPLSLNLSLLRYVDSDRYVRTPRAVAQMNRDYEVLEQKDRLSAWFFGVGPSAALQISKSPYLRENFPYFYNDYAAAILPDLTFGRYFNRPDLNVNLTYRTYGDTYEGFDSGIKIRRHSLGVESVKFLFNYLGFVPFAGPVVTYENLRTSVNGSDFRDNKIALGVTFGWDIRVTKTGTSLLRTNLRYFPDLHLEVEGSKMMFDHLEFNFIQWVQFIGRKKVLR